MIRFRNFKRETKKILISRALTLAILVSVAILLLSSNLKLSQKREMAKERLESLKREVEKFTREREKLKAKISQAENQETLERIAREQLNLRKVGEKVVSFLMLKKEENATPTQSQTLWQKFLEKFKIK